MGNRTAKTDRNGVANYTYDTLNRLVQATNPLPTNPLESFTYDEVGNRVNSNQNGASTFNVANQLLEDSSFTYQYDNNGNLTRKTAKVGGALTSYEYDAENKLVRLVSNGTVINYKYDGLGRRVEKEINDGVTTKVNRFIYDNEDILLELDGSNNIVARYTHGPGIDEPLIMEKNSQSFFYHADGLGSITEITDSVGAVKQRYTYSSFGKVESQLDPNFIQPYTFTSREFDPETGLYFYRARYYDPSAGRFLQEDPIAFGGGINFYTYVGGNPVTFVDPMGLLRYGTPQYNAPPPRTAPLPLDTEWKVTCIELCLDVDLIVTGGAEQQGHNPGSKHYSGDAVDFGFPSNPGIQGRSNDFFCCALRCGFGYGQIEDNHYHIQTVPGLGVPEIPSSVCDCKK